MQGEGQISRKSALAALANAGRSPKSALAALANVGEALNQLHSN